MSKILYDCEQVIQQAKVGLVIDHTFFGYLISRLDIRNNDNQPTMRTNGIQIEWNSIFVASLSYHELLAAFSHEVLHVALGHIWRRGNREPKRWNRACEHVVNLMLVEMGFKLWTDPPPIMDKIYRNLPVEAIYDLLPPAESQSVCLGDCLQPLPDSVNPTTMQVEWKMAVIQAAQAAKAAGQLPASLDRLVNEISKPKVNWRENLWRFFQQLSNSDYTWRYPNRRYIGSGLYLPSLQPQFALPPVVIYWDTSGSRDYAEARRECASELTAIIESCRPEKTYVIYGDAVVQRVEEFEPDDIIQFHPKGGGGTCFEPIFEEVTKRGIQPCCLVGITDMYGSFPTHAPEYPVIWAATTNSTAPFGEVIHLNA